MTINLTEIEDSLGGNWWAYIRTRDFAFVARIPDKIACPVEDDDILIHKEMVEDEMGRKFPELIYHRVLDGDAFEIGPQDVRAGLGEKLVEYINKFHILPYGCDHAKTFKNGNIAVNYKPTQYDKFYLRFESSAIVDPKLGDSPLAEDVANYLKNLTHAQEIIVSSGPSQKKSAVEGPDPGDIGLFQRIAGENDKGSVHIFGAKIKEITRGVSTYQDEETVYYLLLLDGGEVASEKKKTTVRHDFSKITAKCSENGMEKYALEVGDSIAFSGKLKNAFRIGWVVHNIRKFVKE